MFSEGALGPLFDENKLLFAQRNLELGGKGIEGLELSIKTCV